MAHTDDVPPGTPRTNPMWGDDWPAVAANWTLDPAITFLNHGSFGATPTPVLDEQRRLRTEMEREPVDFLARRLPAMVEEARAAASAFLDADPGGLAFVANATTAVSTVLASLDLAPGDRLVTTDHAYPAVLNALRSASARSGAELEVVGVPVPPPEPRAITEAVLAVVDARTKLVLVDHVTSATATILPAGEIVAACRATGVPVMVDGAHAPGMLDVSLRDLDADFWTGNFHKWVCAPKGAAVLWVAAGWRERVHPLVVSHGLGGGFAAEFDFTGTDDYTPWLCVPASIAFMASLGWERVRHHNHELAAYGQVVVSEAVDAAAPVPADRFGSMALCCVPATLAPDAEAALALQRSLLTDDAIEVPVAWWRDAAYLRLSAQVYNSPSHYDRLAEALGTRVRRARSG